MPVLVAGANGFVGRHVVAALRELNSGDPVIAVDRHAVSAVAKNGDFKYAVV